MENGAKDSPVIAILVGQNYVRSTVLVDGRLETYFVRLVKETNFRLVIVQHDVGSCKTGPVSKP